MVELRESKLGNGMGKQRGSRLVLLRGRMMDFLLVLRMEHKLVVKKA